MNFDEFVIDDNYIAARKKAQAYMYNKIVEVLFGKFEEGERGRDLVNSLRQSMASEAKLLDISSEYDNDFDDYSDVETLHPIDYGVNNDEAEEILKELLGEEEE